MNKVVRQTQIEYGDFQTPFDLAKKVCEKLRELGVAPEVVIEPTCGVGAFVEASALSFPEAKRIFGVEVNHSRYACHSERSEESQSLRWRFFAKTAQNDNPCVR